MMLDNCPSPSENTSEFILAYSHFIRVNHHFELHTHDHHEVVLVQYGRFRSQVCGHEYVAFRDDILLYTAGTPHEEWAEGGKPTLTYSCSFKHNGIAPDEPVFRWDAHNKVQEILAELCFWHYADVNNNEQIRHRKEALLVLEALVEELRRLTVYEPRGMVDQVRAFIRSRMTDPITVDDLADLAGLSRCYFIGRYHALTGRTPMEDVRLMRVEEARRIIVTTDLPLYEVAQRVGVASEYHLSHLLKKHLGTGARELRTQGR